MLRAVVCDDDALSRRLVGAVLKRAGFEVMAEMESAITLAAVTRTTKADVVVLDHALLGMTGTAAIPEIRAQAPSCAIVVFSSFGDASVALAAGAEAVVKKGDTPELEAALRRVAKSAK